MAEKSLVAIDKVAGEFLQKFGKSLENYAMRNYDHSTFLKSAMIALIGNKNLSEALKTEQGKMSIFDALRYASTTGLSLNPQEGKAALIGYKTSDGKHIINYQIMKNGMVDLAMESGKVEFITSDYVMENDSFEISKSIDGDKYNFIPATKNRGEIIGFFAALKMKSGHTHIKWMTIEEIEKIRDNYSANWKHKKQDSPWGKSFSGMGIKTVLKALLRNISISDELDNAIGTDDFFEAEFKVEMGATAEDAKEKLEKKEKPGDDESQGALL
jgi:recombination protein RecT